MKNILQLIPIVLLAMLINSCHTNVIELNDGEGGNNPSNPSNPERNELMVNDRKQLNQQIFAESQVCELKFTSENGWHVSNLDGNSQNWVTVTPPHSEVGGEFTLSITVDENTTGSERTTVLELVSNMSRETITITQFPMYKDGTYPEPYQRDEFTDMVQKIVAQNYIKGEIGNIKTEWRFMFDYNKTVIAMDVFQINPETERMMESVHFGGWNINRSIFGVLGGMDVLIYALNSQIEQNEYKFITSQKIEELDYNTGNNPEPRLWDITYRYSNYRRVSQSNSRNNGIIEYKWTDGNITEQVLDNKSIMRFAYGVEDNNRANIDLNTFLNGDIYAAVGLLGKRSRNLLTTISDSNGGVSYLEYSFDNQGRVKTIIRNHLSGGNAQSSSLIYTIYYDGDNIDNGTK